MSEFLHRCSLCNQINAPIGTSAEPVDPGAQLVAQASKTLQDILDGIDQVHQSILQVNTQAQQNSAQAEQARQLRNAGRAQLRVVT